MTKNYCSQNGVFKVRFYKEGVTYSKNVQTEQEAVELIATLKKLSADDLLLLKQQQKRKGYYWHKGSKAWLVKIKGVQYGYYKTEEEARQKALEITT